MRKGIEEFRDCFEAFRSVHAIRAEPDGDLGSVEQGNSGVVDPLNDIGESSAEMFSVDGEVDGGSF